MVQVLEPKESIFGRVGGGIGKGLAEQIPKEVDRYRLAEGLSNLSKQKNLTPFEQFSKLSSIPGITPQMIQSGAELLRQQGISEGFKKIKNKKDQNEPNPLDPYKKPNAPPNSKRPGVATVKPIEATIRPYIPRTREENLTRAAELQEENPQLYPTADLAYQGAVDEDKQLQAQNTALQGQRTGELNVQNNIRTSLEDLKKNANAQIPDNVYQPIEDEALRQVNDLEKPELEAAKDARDKLEEISKQYQDITTLGNWTLPLASPKEVVRSINSLKKSFQKRNDLENFADSLVGRNGISYPYAYHSAFPSEDFPSVNSFMKSLPKITATRTEDPAFETKKIAPELAKAMGKDASPLSIGVDLDSKGYDSTTWLDYLNKNRQRLDLSERQARELGKTRNFLPNLNDLWLIFGSGKDQLLGE